MHNNTLMVELSGDGTYWNINTAGIFKNPYGKNSKEIYNRHTTVAQSAETEGELQTPEQSGTAGTSRMDSPVSSSHKVNTLSPEKQEPDPECSPYVCKGTRDMATRVLVSPDYNAKDEFGKRGKDESYNPDVIIHRLYGAVEIDGEATVLRLHLKRMPVRNTCPARHTVMR